LKKIYFESRSSGWPYHSLYDSLIKYPPQEYRFYTEIKIPKKGSFISYFIKNSLKYNRTHHLIDYFIPPIYLGYYAISNIKRPIDADLTYASQHIIFRNEPWIVDLEFATALVGYGKLLTVRRIIEKYLSSKYCKWILPWSEMAYKSILLSLDCKAFVQKIQTVPLAVTQKHFKREKKDDNIRLLFVGTKNIFNIPYSFELKGGYVMLSAFERLKMTYPHVELIIRSQVPSSIKQKYGTSENIHIIDGIISETELADLFNSSDIFIFPGHQTPGRVILDAMSYGLPIIASDVWANREMVENGANGFLIQKSQNLNYYDKNLIPLWGEPEFLKRVSATDTEMVNDLVDKLTILIINRKLREKMGRAGKMKTDMGKFSIVKRNKTLEKLFNEITA